MDKERAIYDNLFFILGTVFYQLFSSTQNGGKRKRALTKRRRLGRRKKRQSARRRYRGGVFISSIIIQLFAVLLALVSVILQGGNKDELFRDTTEIKRVIIENGMAPSFMLNFTNNSTGTELEDYTYSPIQFDDNSFVANILISGIKKIVGPNILQNKKFLQLFDNVEKYKIAPGSSDLKQLVNSSSEMLLTDGQYSDELVELNTGELASSDKTFEAFTQQVAYFAKKAENMSTSDIVFYSMKLLEMAMLNTENKSILRQIDNNLDNAYLAESNDVQLIRNAYEEEDRELAKIFKNVYEMNYGQRRKQNTQNFDTNKKLIYAFAAIFSVYLARQQLRRKQNVEAAEEIIEEEIEPESEGADDNFSTTADNGYEINTSNFEINKPKTSFFGCGTSEFENVNGITEAKAMHKKCCARNIKNMFSSKRQNNCFKLEQQYSIGKTNSMGGRRKTKKQRRRRHYY